MWYFKERRIPPLLPPHPSSLAAAVHDCLFSMFTVNPHLWGPFGYPQPADALGSCSSLLSASPLAASFHYRPTPLTINCKVFKYVFLIYIIVELYWCVMFLTSAIYVFDVCISPSNDILCTCIVPGAAIIQTSLLKMNCVRSTMVMKLYLDYE